MKSLSSIGLGLSVVFGCLLLALVAELYYLLWWKKRFITRDIENDFSNPARDFLYMFCCRQNPSLFSSSSLTTQEMTNSTSLVAGTQLGQNKDLWVKPMNDNEYDYDMCNYYLGQDQNPRFLFTIVEETQEDLESEDGKSSKSRKGSRNLSDLFVNNNLVETPYLTPIDSPSFFVTTPAPPLTPLMKPTSCFYNNSNSNINNYNNNTNHGFNPLLESSTDAEFSRIRSSPPPKFKFLQDAEEKLYRRRLMEEDEVSEKKKNGSNNITTKINTNNIDGFSQENGRNEEEEEEEEEEGSFITIIVDRNKEKATCSQVIPLASSPSTTFSDHHHHHQQQQYSRIISKFP